MPLSNYRELQNSVADWLDRTDLEARIPDFIRLAEHEIFRDLRCAQNEVRTVYTSGGFQNDEGIDLPKDYQSAKAVLYDGRPMDRKTDQWYYQHLAERPAQGRPYAFARVTNRVLFYPPPDTNSDVTLTYWQSQGPLVNDEDTTQVLTRVPGLYLFGALKQAAAFLIGDERVPLWETKYATILEEMNLQAEEDELSGSTVQVSNIYGDDRSD